MTNIHFNLKNGEKEVDVKLEEVDEKYIDLVLLQAFKLMNLNVEMEGMINVYKKTGKAFEEFFSSINPSADEKEFVKSKGVEKDKESKEISKNEKIEKIENKVEVVKEVKEVKEIESVEKPKEDVKTNEESDGEKPDFYTTGIKMKNGIKTYRCRYWCECGDSANHYIPEKTFKVNCYNCGRGMKVETANEKEKFPNRDEFGNYFVAKKQLG